MTIDPISNMLVQIKNGNASKKETVSVPLSNVKYAITETLKRAGFVKEVHKPKAGKRNFEVELMYHADGNPRVIGIQRISKLSRRVYAGAQELGALRRGKPGTMIISTPKGILTKEEAKKSNVGGEVLFAIW